MFDTNKIKEYTERNKEKVIENLNRIQEIINEKTQDNDLEIQKRLYVTREITGKNTYFESQEELLEQVGFAQVIDTYMIDFIGTYQEQENVVRIATPSSMTYQTLFPGYGILILDEEKSKEKNMPVWKCKFQMGLHQEYEAFRRVGIALTKETPQDGRTLIKKR